jgi:aspartyl/asparaginyl-tRNA synthetase
MCKVITPKKFDGAISALRSFFQNKGFVEVPTHQQFSILATCEYPTTSLTCEYQNKVWPLPQSAQMWLDTILLDNPDIKGCFTVSMSYHNEPPSHQGNHLCVPIFPMFEFAYKGDMKGLIALEKGLLEHIGFEKKWNTSSPFKSPEFDYPEGNYKDLMIKYQTDELDREHERCLDRDYGEVFFLKNFPIYTSPFWNMKKSGDISKKVAIILHGIETIGSAERSCDKAEMREQFMSIRGGEYAGWLYYNYGKMRVEKEMDEFLDREFFPRYGGGISVTRMIRAMEMSELITA